MLCCSPLYSKYFYPITHHTNLFFCDTMVDPISPNLGCYLWERCIKCSRKTVLGLGIFREEKVEVPRRAVDISGHTPLSR